LLKDFSKMKAQVISSVSLLLGLAAAHPSRAAHASDAFTPRQRTNITSRKFDRANPYVNWPSFSQLPLDSSYPTGAAWGVWGADDVYGALNHINATTITAASKEIKIGRTIPLNLEVGRFINPIVPSRKPLQHLFQPGQGYIDDVVVMNTQITTQYDGLRHFPYSTNASVESYRWYNDLIASYDDVIGSTPTAVLGIQQVAQHGIAGRAVLLDWAGYAAAKNITYDAFTGREITTAEWDAVAAWQGLPADWARPGDILITRTGWLKKFNSLNVTDAETLPWLGSGESIGFETSDRSAEWLWSRKFALVGSDNPAFEALPMNKTIGGVPRSLHQLFIGGKTMQYFLNSYGIYYCSGRVSSVAE
jgi:hypothetical protein